MSTHSIVSARTLGLLPARFLNTDSHTDNGWMGWDDLTYTIMYCMSDNEVDDEDYTKYNAVFTRMTSSTFNV